MRRKFDGENGGRHLTEALLEQRFVEGNYDLAAELAQNVELFEFRPGEVLIEQHAQDDDVYMLLTGRVEILVNGKAVGSRYAGMTVGEMAAVSPLQRRSATVIAAEEVVAARITERTLSAFADNYPRIWRFFAKDLARMLLDRNKLVAAKREQTEVFIISSVEALHIARAIQSALEHDPFNVVVWTDGVFRAGKYTVESLEDALSTADFAVAIAQPDEEVTSREATVHSPRDNVIFELGFFMGRLGRMRAILFEPRGEEVELPSDLKGVVTIPYTMGSGKNTAASIAPACNRLRNHVLELGPLEP